MSATLDAQGLVKEYLSSPALGPVDLQVEPGQLVALIGENGAGKSTFLNLCAGLLEPTSGSVTIVGASAGTTIAREATALVPDTPVLYDDISLLEQAEYLAGIYGIPDWLPKLNLLMDRFGIMKRANDLPGHLSAGLRQKAMLSLTFLRPFRLLLADEPFESLDPSGVVSMTEMLREAASNGAAVVVATHRMDYTYTCDRRITLSDGRLISDEMPVPRDKKV